MSDKSQPESFEYGEDYSDLELIQVFWTHFIDSDSHFAKWRKDIRRYYRLYAGDNLLDKADQDFIRATRRPLINLNYTIGTCNAIIGAQTADRKEVQFRGVSVKDFDGIIADWLTKITRTATQGTQGYRKESDASLDMLITGYGYMEHYLDTTKIPIPVASAVVPPWEIWSDPDALEDCLTDATFFIRRKYWELEQAQARWPDKAKDLLHAVQQGSVPTSFPEQNTHDTVYTGAATAGKLRVPIYEYQYCRYEPYVMIVDPETDEPMELPRAEAKKFIDSQATLGNIVTAQYNFAKKVHYRAFITGDQGTRTGIMLERKPISVNQFTIKVVTGYKHKMPAKGRCIFFGVTRTILDAQKYLNRAVSVYLEILARGSKGGGYIEQSAIPTSKEEFERQNAVPGGWTLLADGAIAENKIMERGTVTIPEGFDRMMGILVQSFGQLTGVTDFVKGTANNERSNVLVSNLQQQSYTMINSLFDPITKFQIENGMVIVELMLKHYNDGQLNRIIGNEEIDGLTVEMSVDPSTGKEVGTPISTPAEILRSVKVDEYDVTADIGKANTTQKQQFWNMVVQTDMLATLQSMLPDPTALNEIAPDLIRYMPLPEDICDKMADKVEARIEQDRQLQNVQGVFTALTELPPDQAMQVIQAAAQALQQQQMQQPQQQQPQASPPGGPTGSQQPPM